MSQYINLTENLLKHYLGEIRPQEIGRYSCSKVYGIIKGYTSVEQYIKGEKFEFPAIMRMWNGTSKHKQIEPLLELRGYTCEQKVEKTFYVPLMTTGEITLTGKCDAINDTEVLEVKTSEKLYQTPKEWHTMQLTLYLSLFNREKGRIVQPVVKKDGLYLKVLGEVKRNEEAFNKIIGKLQEFNLKVMEYIKQNGK